MADSLKAQTSTSSPEVAYEIFVQSYKDSNGDGIGDLQGLISKLDYIQELGATMIWLMPIHPSPSYHKYDVMDYYGIHKDYGTMADMDSLIREMKKRKMKLILDLVVNHTSNQHPWFVASSSPDSNEYTNYYVWRNFEEVKNEIEKKTTTFDSDNITQWHESSTRPERYYGFFSGRMPDLNFDNPAVRKEVYKIGKFWLDKGVDGFRLDAAKHIYPDDRLDDTRKFWKEFTTEMRKVDPDVKLFGEVWSDPKTVASLFSGLPSMFNFSVASMIHDCIITHDPKVFTTAYEAMDSTYKSTGMPYEDATLLSNHDMNRIRSTLGESIGQSKLAGAILLTLPGTPFIYYGEEIGMLGMKPDEYLREPFVWSNKTRKDSTWLKPKYSIHNKVSPLDSQMVNQKSMYTFYKFWISMRKTHPALTRGSIEFIKTDYPNVLAFIRRYKDEELMVIHNLDEKPVEIKMTEPFTTLNKAPNQLDEHRLLIPRYGSGLLKLNSKE
ncbi:MAG TPA: alpha-amylase family glycosyl hydrolase [Saprospiraceae bacterium]|nr:alpha-amylase family glycosyl hydrolase [Saprospiraceae bacterium]